MGTVEKLIRLIGDAEIAAQLVAAGLDTPAKIKAESVEDLETLLGVEDAAVVTNRFGIS